MTATIKLTFNREGQEVSYEATYDGERWHSQDNPTAHFLNAYSKNWRLRDYHPCPVIGTAMEVVEDLKDPFDAAFVRADEIDYSDIPDDALF